MLSGGNIVKKLVLVAFVILQSAMTAGCNTVAGAGEDVSHAGHAVTHAADDNRD
jgi:predicted small secreted protein